MYVEEKLLEALEVWLREYKLNWIEGRKRTNINREIDLLQKAIKKSDDNLKNLEIQMEKIYNLLEQGVYTTDTFLERSRVITERIAVAKQDRQKLLFKLNQETVRNESQKVIIPKVEHILKLYRETNSPAVKNELLREIINKAVYNKTTKAHRNRPSFYDFELNLFPRIPHMKSLE